ncbi:MAG: AAA family ATPase, partial [Myxococcales bacterium]|nr:AAA family ATPase [Myxococcales bacterium]
MRLAGYTTREVVHEGAKSEIHRATRDADGRQVILKIPRAGALTHQRLAELRHEHYVASRLKNEGVVEVLALEERGAHPFLVFEDFGGVSLDRAFAGKIGLASFYRVALQICDALVHIHGCGVIHKDIKPHNILISQRTGTVKITDLAIASLLTNEASSLAPAAHLVGTIAYMAPEQTGRIGQGIDTRADLYALGVTFFELLSGRRPFPQTEPMELIHAHIAREPPRLVDVEPSVGPELSAVVARLLAKNPDERYRSALSLRADLIFLRGRQRSGGDEPFEPGQRCRAAEFRLPQRLYGREREVEQLLRAFAHAAADARALVLIAGSSGTGKSALVHEVHRPMVAKRGSFIAGKFDQYNRSVPFAALLQTLRQLIDLVLAGSDAEVEEWRRRLLDALGSQVAVLVDTVPELEHVVGEQPPPTTVSSTEAQNRLHLAVLRFLRVFARADHPLVIFLDDLQWADVATVALLKALVTDPEIDNVLVIGAYRDREVGAGHPLPKAIAEIKASPTRLEEIELGPLVARDVLRMVADALA